jgi:hypothetical protein
MMLKTGEMWQAGVRSRLTATTIDNKALFQSVIFLVGANVRRVDHSLANEMQKGSFSETGMRQ